MPIYPALALLLGSALAEERFFRLGSRIQFAIFSSLAVGLGAILWLCAAMPARGELADALAQHPEMYTLSMGHMGDLTLAAFAYLRLPLALAVAAFGISAAGLWVYRKRVGGTIAVTVVGMTVFFQAARLALVRFDSYLGSYPLAQALLASPPGTLIEGDAYYSFSSVFFYTNRPALLLNGRINNLEYGSYAPNAPSVFIDDAEFVRRWCSSDRYYLLVNNEDLPHLRLVLGNTQMHLVKGSSGKALLRNF